MKQPEDDRRDAGHHVDEESARRERRRCRDRTRRSHTADARSRSGSQIAEASATISIVPEQRALDPADARRLEERVAGFGSVVKKLPAPCAEPLVQQVVDDEHERDERDQPCPRRSGPARGGRAGRRAGLTAKRASAGLAPLVPGALMRGPSPRQSWAAGWRCRPVEVRPRARDARRTRTRARALTSSVSTNSTSPGGKTAPSGAGPAPRQTRGDHRRRQGVALAEQVAAELRRVADHDRHRDRLADRAPEPRASPRRRSPPGSRAGPAVRIISQRVAPRPSAASFWSDGTVAMTSREIADTIGRIMIARIRPAMK